MNMNKTIITKDLLASLYLSGLSMMDIAQKYNVSHHIIAYHMEKFGIKRRSINDALYKKHNPKGDPFKIKLPASASEAKLFGLGLGIYWGEGNKADKYSVRIGTTDPEMILIFRQFMKTFCGIAPEKFKYSLMCFKDTKPVDAKNYWIKILHLQNHQIGKVTNLKPLGKGRYKKVSQYQVADESQAPP